MSAHALLVMHNLTVVEAFFEGIREVLRGSGHAILLDVDHDSIDGTEKKYDWIHEVDLYAAYDGSLRVVDDATGMWKDVDLAREKGRLGREKEREKERQEQGDNEDVGISGECASIRNAPDLQIQGTFLTLIVSMCPPGCFVFIPFYLVVYSIYTMTCIVVTYPFASATLRDNRKSYFLSLIMQTIYAHDLISTEDEE